MENEIAADLEESIIAMEMERPKNIEKVRGVSVEEACKQFRKYLIEMIAEEKDARDLRDVEELLECYRDVRLTVYRDLIVRFYVEICVDIFSLSCLPDDISTGEISDAPS